jgi:hypothetical protein
MSIEQALEKLKNVQYVNICLSRDDYQNLLKLARRDKTHHLTLLEEWVSDRLQQELDELRP